MDYLTTFLGRSTFEWIDIEGVLQKHNIKNAKQLDDQLTYRALTTPQDVPVVDAKNPSRLLGHIKIELASLNPSSVLNMAVMPTPVISRNPCAEVSTNMKVVRFAVGRTTSDGWHYHPRLETNDSLTDLMKLDKFRLPGETERQFWDRWRSR